VAKESSKVKEANLERRSNKEKVENPEEHLLYWGLHFLDSISPTAGLECENKFFRDGMAKWRKSHQLSPRN